MSPPLAPDEPLGWPDIRAWDNGVEGVPGTNLANLGWTSGVMREPRQVYAEAGENHRNNARERMAGIVYRIDANLGDNIWIIGMPVPLPTITASHCSIACRA